MKIVVSSLSLKIPIFSPEEQSIKNRMLFRSQNTIVREILKDISFELVAGDRLGILGANGSGKTSLLRCLAGAYQPSSGSVVVDGRIQSMIDLNLGLDFEASGYKNIILKLGLVDRSLCFDRKKIQEIVEFSGLGDAIFLPIRTYSTGMVMRLAFSIATSVSADVLLLDEWLSVGDAEFSVRANQRLEMILSSSAIVVIASHDKSLIEKLCNKRILISKGEIQSHE